ncbi:hypothetical protein M430DRAFT_17237 [Amorphotheca resinae ATCC 22711]|uniref:Altered inheritance of mitochondria protein 9, mitochondrial n=1 Tax=Amorphotheca resinae ATCC 22711 TaxID=857342 RepID=A0A2T3B8W8_AMORE|nr:hypothetical protein M430DRAFT_17237 [Amorphotheca resinae ATCC 22711]PSS23315.1 hypothetical protein M430DRAFT_17237 [Amorphotheca resinae ATCC 22711]
MDKEKEEPALSWTSFSHPDLHLDSIFVDPGTRRITRIIDWQSASVFEAYFQHCIPRILAPVWRNSSETESDISTQRHQAKEREIASHYQRFSKLNNPNRWAASKLPLRSLTTEPTSVLCGASDKDDVYSLQTALIHIAVRWDEIGSKPGPCPIRFLERELEFHSNEMDLVQGLANVLHELHDKGLIPLGGMLYRENYERAAPINKEHIEEFVNTMETEE